MAMLDFQTFSGLLLLNLAFCCVKIAGILAIRWLLLKFPVYILDPSAIAIMAASHGLEVRSEEGQGPTPLMCAALLGDTAKRLTQLEKGIGVRRGIIRTGLGRNVAPVLGPLHCRPVAGDKVPAAYFIDPQMRRPDWAS